MSILLLNDAGSTLYTFPSGFDLHTVEDLNWQARTKLADRFYAPGSQELSDRGIDDRAVKVSGAYHGASQAVFQAFWQALNGALRNNGEQYRFSFETGYNIKVDHAKDVKVKRLGSGLTYKSADIEFTLSCPDPHWYYGVTQDTDSDSLASSPLDVVLSHQGNVPVPLAVTITPSATLSSFTLANVTDGGQIFQYADSGLASGTELVIDADAGTCERDGLNTIRFYTGAWLRLLPGNNTLRYTGPTGGTIEFGWWRRFL